MKGASKQGNRRVQEALTNDETHARTQPSFHPFHPAAYRPYGGSPHGESSNEQSFHADDHVLDSHDSLSH